MKKMLLCAVLLMLATTAFAGSGPAPTVSVSSVTITTGAGNAAPVCRSNNSGPLGVSATVTAAFDQNTSNTNTGQCKTERTQGTITGYSRTDTVTNVTYSNQTVTASAVDSNGAGPATMTLADVVNSIYAGSLAVGPEGKTTVTVNASASELQTTETDSVFSTWPASAGGCTGTPDSSVTTSGTPSSTTLTSSTGSASASYLVDLLPPTVPDHGTDVAPPGVPPMIDAGGQVLVGLKLENGSAGTPLSVTVTATAPDGVTSYSVTDTTAANGTVLSFNNSNDGIASQLHVGPVALTIPCAAPGGLYSLSLTANTQDLCGNAWDPIIVSAKSFQVNAAIQFNVQTAIVAEFPGGEYAIDQCFLSSKSNNNVQNNPGSVHIATLVNLVLGANNACATSADQFKNVTLEFDLPYPFVFDLNGNSPYAHVFTGDASCDFLHPNNCGFEFHYGKDPLSEITTAKNWFNPQKPTNIVTIDLSKVNLIGFPGVFPSNYVIYARAHARYGSTTPASPDQLFFFTTKATGTLVNAASGSTTVSGTNTYSVISNPTTASCVNGQLQ